MSAETDFLGYKVNKQDSGRVGGRGPVSLTSSPSKVHFMRNKLNPTFFLSKPLVPCRPAWLPGGRIEAEGPPLPGSVSTRGRSPEAAPSCCKLYCPLLSASNLATRKQLEVDLCV